MSLLERRRALMSQNREKYVFVEYLQSTGTEWIDTGFKPNGNTAIDVDFQFTSYNTTSTIVGVRGNSTGNYQAMYVLWVRNGIFEMSHGHQLNMTILSTPADTKRHTIKREKSMIYLDDKPMGFNAATFTSPYSLEVFACNNNGAKGSWCANMKLYSLKIYDNGVLAKDLKPCYRKRGKVAGLYDVVNDVFYENKGTGEFLIGGEV